MRGYMEMKAADSFTATTGHFLRNTTHLEHKPGSQEA